MIDRVFLHDLNAKLDYTVDWSPWLEDQSDTIASVVVTPSSGLTVTSQSNTTTTATAWVTIDSGVSKGRLLTLAFRITTAGGRIDERTLTIRAAQQ